MAAEWADLNVDAPWAGLTNENCSRLLLRCEPEFSFVSSIQPPVFSIQQPVSFRLDSRVRTGFAVENLAIMRHFAFDFIRLAKGVEGGITNRKKTLSWSVEKLTAAIVAA